MVPSHHGRRLTLHSSLRSIQTSNHREHPNHPEASHNQVRAPEEILTDRGSQFYANEGERKEKGISQFEQYLANAGIKHILCRVNHPQTNGKLERFYGVLEEKWRRGQLRNIPEYVHWHNEIKPHLSLNIDTLEKPIQAFQRKLPEDRKNLIKIIQDAK